MLPGLTEDATKEIIDRLDEESKPFIRLVSKSFSGLEYRKCNLTKLNKKNYYNLMEEIPFSVVENMYNTKNLKNPKDRMNTLEILVNCRMLTNLSTVREKQIYSLIHAGLAHIYYDGLGGIEDEIKAFNYWIISNDLFPIGSSASNLALCHFSNVPDNNTNKNREEAIKWIKRAIELYVKTKDYDAIIAYPLYYLLIHDYDLTTIIEQSDINMCIASFASILEENDVDDDNIKYVLKNIKITDRTTAIKLFDAMVPFISYKKQIKCFNKYIIPFTSHIKPYDMMGYIQFFKDIGKVKYVKYVLHTTSKTDLIDIIIKLTNN